MSDDLTVYPVAFSSPEITQMMGRYERELVSLGVRLNHGWSGGVADEQFDGGRGVFLLIRRGGEPVACGGIRMLEPGVAEIKRMYVEPHARRGGLARRLLGELERWSARLGAQVARLDTGREMAPAHAFYRSAGYREIADYNGNPDAGWWFEKDLAPLV